MVRRSACAIVACVLGALAGPASALAAGSPSIESEAASHLTPTGATLEAQVDPDGLGTEYQFRVVADPCEANPTNCEIEPDPLYPPTPSTIAAGSGAQPASVNLHDAGLTLEPGQEYHYAVVATNTEGTVTGPDQTFTTADSPSVLSEAATDVSTHDATMRAEIDPGAGNSAGAYYQFELANDPGALLPDITCPPEPMSGPFLPCIGARMQGVLPISFLPSGSPAGVSLDLADTGLTLQPGTTYHYRVLVAPAVQTEDTIEWEAPTVAGADQTFSTLHSVCLRTTGSCGGPPPKLIFSACPKSTAPRNGRCVRRAYCGHRHHRRHHHRHKHHHRHRHCGR
jgi:hypothetical protein